MRPVWRGAQRGVSALIVVLWGGGVVCQGAARRLVGLQKFLTRKIEGRA